MESVTPFPYDGPAELAEPVEAALRRVVDPEVALTIVDVGLVYGVSIDDGGGARVRLTMTSAACPVADVIVDDVAAELERVLPPGMPVDVDLVWEPPWTPAMMSERARRFMGW
jgi:metal-sulfur cluster biosynthetic enzyme